MSVTDASSRAPLFLLAIAAVGWYATARVSAEALADGQPSPGRRALGHLLPGAVVAMVAVILGMPEIVMGVVFGSSVAALTLVLGIITLTSGVSHPTAHHSGAGFPVIPKSDSAGSEPIGLPEQLPPRIWSFVLPVALIAMLVGFSGSVGWMGVAILLVEGLALLVLQNPAPTSPRGFNFARSFQFLAAILAAVVAAWAGVRATRDISNTLGQPGCGLVTALMVAPALVLPMIGSGMTLAHHGRFDQAITTQISFVLLNLCGLLPLAAALWLTGPYWRPPLHSASAMVFTKPAVPTTAPATTSASEDAAAALPVNLPYPMAAWRVDAVLLVAVGLLLLPITLGRWSLGMGEGLALMLAYAFYMILTTVMAH